MSRVVAARRGWGLRGSGLEGSLWRVCTRCPAVPASLFCSGNRCFQSVLVHVQLLWELVLLGEPLVVVAPSPTMSSEVVLALARYQTRTRSPAGGC